MLLSFNLSFSWTPQLYTHGCNLNQTLKFCFLTQPRTQPRGQTRTEIFPSLALQKHIGFHFFSLPVLCRILFALVHCNFCHPCSLCWYCCCAHHTSLPLLILTVKTKPLFYCSGLGFRTRLMACQPGLVLNTLARQVWSAKIKPPRSFLST